jgi:transglutaminase-like putative cysteine protease
MNESSHYRVRHVTSYEYGSDVVLSHQLLHLVPRPVHFQQCFEHSIEISPSAYRRRDEFDAFGNPVTRLELDHPHHRLAVTTEMQIRVHRRAPALAGDTLPWERVASQLSYKGLPGAREDLEASRFRYESPYVRVKKMFTDYAESCFPAGKPVLEGAQELMSKLHRDFEYAPGETTVATPVTDLLKNRRGVCQDFAHLMIACLRSRGLAARYISGYVRMLQPKDEAAAGKPAADEASCAEAIPAGAPPPSTPEPDLIGGAASHAWVSVYAPPFGWVDLDPTNDTYVGTDHVSIACGRDFGDVSPLRGVILGGGRHSLVVQVSVDRLGD